MRGDVAGAGDDEAAGAGRIVVLCVGVVELDFVVPVGFGDPGVGRCVEMLRAGMPAGCSIELPLPESGPDIPDMLVALDMPEAPEDPEAPETPETPDIPDAFAAGTPPAPTAAPRAAYPAPPVADDVRSRGNAPSDSPCSHPAGAVGSAGAHPAPDCAPRAFTLALAPLPDKALPPRAAPATPAVVPLALLPRVVAGGFQTVGRVYRPFERGAIGVIRASAPTPEPMPELIPE
jgi:hypothetical protein